MIAIPKPAECASKVDFEITSLITLSGPAFGIFTITNWRNNGVGSKF